MTPSSKICNHHSLQFPAGPNTSLQMIKQLTPRGIRNNNPLNIRIGNTWLGEVRNPTDPSFEQFVSMEYGLRAAFVLLRRYINHYHRTTIPEVIAAWAPASENNTVAYVDKVCRFSLINPDDRLVYSDKDQMCRLVAAMILVENGCPVDTSKIEKGYTLA